MPTPKLALAALAAALVPHLSAHAQEVTSEWTVVAAEHASISLPALPAATRTYTDTILGDLYGDQIGLRMSLPDASAGYWSRRPNGSWVRYAAINTPGAIPGPGRSGNESAHVFTSIVSGGSGAAGDGQRLFSARAGHPQDANTRTLGLWRWNGSANIEILRALTDGTLGPGLGPNWVINNENAALEGRALTAGRALFSVVALSPTQAERRMIAMHVPGQGNLPCILRDATDPALSPGLAAGDYFNASWTLSDLAVTPEARVYGTFSVSGSRTGIWEICNGAPRALVTNGETGARGPHLGIATAAFGNVIGTPRPSLPGMFHFFSNYRTAPAQSLQTGLFWHDGQVNRPLAINGDGAAHGPGWLDTTWRSFDTNTLTAAGPWALFSSSVNTADSGNPSGLWRVHTGQNPELLALIGLTGQYGPEANRTWAGFLARAILANGDVILLARTNPGSEVALWLLQQGKAPRRLLTVGDTLTVPTTSGPSPRIVNSLDVSDTVAQHGGGQDSWVSADGTILIQATLSGFGASNKVHLRSRPSDPGVMFASGFEN